MLTRQIAKWGEREKGTLRSISIFAVSEWNQVGVWVGGGSFSFIFLADLADTEFIITATRGLPLVLSAVGWNFFHRYKSSALAEYTIIMYY